VVVGVVLLASVARLDYGRGPGAEQCPDAESFAARVEEKLGRSPFDADATEKIAVHFDAEADRATLRATVSRTGEDAPRRLEENGPDCTRLAERAVQAVVDLFPPTPSDPSLLAPPTMMVDRPAGSTSEPVSGSPSPSPIAARLGGGALAGAGFAPAANFGIYVYGGIAFRSWSLDLEGRFDLPASEATRDYTVRTALRVVQVVVCTRRGPAFGCALAGGGPLEARGENPNDAQEKTFFHGHLGVRAGIESPITGPLGLRVAFDVLVPITRSTIEVRGTEAWITQPFGFAFSAGPTLRF
jgi:hypothetical protein